MRILLISDIHANLVALETVLAHARGQYDTLWCLGDVVGYGPAPNECIERLRELNPLCLAGNHDWAVLGKLPLEEFNPDARRALAWTRTMLKENNRAWLDQLSGKIVLTENDLTLVHASPRQPIWEYISTTTIASENLPYFETSICFFGHTHVPMIYHHPLDELALYPAPLRENRRLSLEPKLLLNPGSVGQPRDGDPRAAYALLELEARALTHYRVHYDIAATQAAMVKARLPRRLIERLNYGM